MMAPRHLVSCYPKVRSIGSRFFSPGNHSNILIRTIRAWSYFLVIRFLRAHAPLRLERRVR